MNHSVEEREYDVYRIIKERNQYFTPAVKFHSLHTTGSHTWTFFPSLFITSFLTLIFPSKNWWQIHRDFPGKSCRGKKRRGREGSCDDDVDRLHVSVWFVSLYRCFMCLYHGLYAFSLTLSLCIYLFYPSRHLSLFKISSFSSLLFVAIFAFTSFLPPGICAFVRYLFSGALSLEVGVNGWQRQLGWNSQQDKRLTTRNALDTITPLSQTFVVCFSSTDFDSFFRPVAVYVFMPRKDSHESLYWLRRIISKIHPFDVVT